MIAEKKSIPKVDGKEQKVTLTRTAADNVVVDPDRILGSPKYCVPLQFPILPSSFTTASNTSTSTSSFSSSSSKATSAHNINDGTDENNNIDINSIEGYESIRSVVRLAVQCINVHLPRLAAEGGETNKSGSSSDAVEMVSFGNGKSGGVAGMVMSRDGELNQINTSTLTTTTTTTTERGSKKDALRALLLAGVSETLATCALVLGPRFGHGSDCLLMCIYALVELRASRDETVRTCIRE